MKTYKIDKEQPNNGTVLSINGKAAAKHIKHSKKYQKNSEPYIYLMGLDRLYITDKQSFEKMYIEKETGKRYHVGSRYAWILKEV